MFEVLVGLVLCFSISLGVRVYLRFFQKEAARALDFERWCRCRPLVAAFLCTGRDGGRAVHDELRFLLGAGRFANRQGRYPWQHYVIEYEARRLADDRVGLFVVGHAMRGPRCRVPDLKTVLDGLGRSAGAQVDTLWLHGALHARPSTTTRHDPRLGWVGDFDDQGALDVELMIGRPAWLEVAQAA